MSTSFRSTVRPHPPARVGFTLIELLVVVAIIGLLVAILLPSLRSARAQAKQVVCLTTLRTLGQAAHFYAEDNGDWLVRGESPNMHFAVGMLRYIGYSGGKTRWRALVPTELLEAARETELLNCPSFPTPGQPLDFVVNAFPDPYVRTRNDRPNEPPGDAPVTDGGVRIEFTRRAELERRRPAEFIYITEAHQAMPLPDDVAPRSQDRGVWGQFHDLFLIRQLPFGGAPRISNDQRHPGGVTALFFDSHADVVPTRRLDPGGGPTPLEDRLRFFTQFAGAVGN